MKITNRFQKIISFVKDIKTNRQTGKNFHASVALKGGNIIEYGINYYNKITPKKYGKYKSTRTNNKNEFYQAGLHSEVDLIMKLENTDIDIHKLTLLNIRIDNNNNIAIATPCPNCMRILKQNKFKKIFYTIDNETIGKVIY